MNEINILLFIQKYLQNSFLTPAMKFITYSGNNAYIWIFIGIILLANKKKRYVGVLIFAVLLEVLVFNNLLIKNIVGRLRPFDSFDTIKLLITKPSGYSFISGHSTSSFASAIIIYKYLPKKQGVLALIYALLIAFSRLYFGVHYPSDVIIGMLFGIFLALVTSFIYNKYFNKNLS